MAKQYPKREKTDTEEFSFKGHWRMDHVCSPVGKIHSRNPNSKEAILGTFPLPPRVRPGAEHLYKPTKALGTNGKVGDVQKQYSKGVQTLVKDGETEIVVGNCATPKPSVKDEYQQELTEHNTNKIKMTLTQLKSELQYYRNQSLNQNADHNALAQQIATYEALIAVQSGVPTPTRKQSPARPRSAISISAPATPMSPSMQRSMDRHLERLRRSELTSPTLCPASPKSPLTKQLKGRARFDELQVDVSSPGAAKSSRTPTKEEIERQRGIVNPESFLKKQSQTPSSLKSPGMKRQESVVNFMGEVTKIAQTVPQDGEEWKSRSPIRPIMTNMGSHGPMVKVAHVPKLKDKKKKESD